MVKLVIVESPAKCKKIEGYLGPGYKCVASFGHFRGITNGLKDIDVYGNFRPNYNALEGKSKYINNLRKHIRVADDIVLATDDDREGEAIAWHLANILDVKPSEAKRVVFNAITKTVGVAESNEFGGSALAYMAVDPALAGKSAVSAGRPSAMSSLCVLKMASMAALSLERRSSGDPSSRSTWCIGSVRLGSECSRDST